MASKGSHLPLQLLDTSNEAWRAPAFDLKHVRERSESLAQCEFGHIQPVQASEGRVSYDVSQATNTESVHASARIDALHLVLTSVAQSFILQRSRCMLKHVEDAQITARDCKFLREENRMCRADWIINLGSLYVFGQVAHSCRLLGTCKDMRPKS